MLGSQGAKKRSPSAISVLVFVSLFYTSHPADANCFPFNEAPWVEFSVRQLVESGETFFLEGGAELSGGFLSLYAVFSDGNPNLVFVDRYVNQGKVAHELTEDEILISVFATDYDKEGGKFRRIEQVSTSESTMSSNELDAIFSSVVELAKDRKYLGCVDN